jgi:hypothetical protein
MRTGEEAAATLGSFVTLFLLVHDQRHDATSPWPFEPAPGAPQVHQRPASSVVQGDVTSPACPSILFSTRLRLSF